MMWSGWGEYKGMKFMPEIKPISFLRSTQEISELCHSTDSPVFLTKNGYGDLVIMILAPPLVVLGIVTLQKKVEPANLTILLHLH